MKSVFAVILPAFVSGHGIALPHTTNLTEVRQAGEGAMLFIDEVVKKCHMHVLECLPAATHGWEAGANCLIEHFEKIKHEECIDSVEHMARHLPLALFASGKHDVEEFESSLGDIGKRVNKGCDLDNDTLPYVWSYHVHFQWEFQCKDCRASAMDWIEKFVKEFQPDIEMCRRLAFLTDLWNTNSIPRNDSQHHHFADMCEMATLPPGGPFVHSEKGFTLSTTMFHKVLPWLMANRPQNDHVFAIVHPNTGCQYNDLRHWSLWVSPSTSMFYHILKGCVWASCEDKVLGCIAFNHLGKSQGYGPCYTPPSEFSIDCKMELEKTGNTSTLECAKSLDLRAVV